MTREEIISNLLYMKRSVKEDTIEDRTIDEVIKALEQEPKFIVKSDGTIEQIKNCDDCVFKKEWEKIGKLLLVVLEKQTEQEPILDKIRAESEDKCKNCEYYHNPDYTRCHKCKVESEEDKE